MKKQTFMISHKVLLKSGKLTEHPQNLCASLLRTAGAGPAAHGGSTVPATVAQIWADGGVQLGSSQPEANPCPPSAGTPSFRIEDTWTA